VLVLSPVSVFHIHPHLSERERAREQANEKPTIPFDSLQLLEESHEEFEFGFCFARCHCHCPAVTVHRAGLGYAFSKHISANTKATRTKKKKKPLENGHGVSAIRIRHVAPPLFGARVTKAGVSLTLCPSLYLSPCLLSAACCFCKQTNSRSAVRTKNRCCLLAEKKIHFNRHRLE